VSSRYYCPECGQVAGYSRDHFVALVVGGTVEPHFLSSALTSILGDPGARVREICPGGRIDVYKDRAP